MKRVTRRTAPALRAVLALIVGERARRSTASAHAWPVRVAAEKALFPTKSPRKMLVCVNPHTFRQAFFHAIIFLVESCFGP